MDDFYAARSRTIPPLPWSSFPPPFSESGASLIVVEQDVGQAMKVADRVYCMMEGRITLEGRPAELSREAIHDAYFGVSA